VRDLGDAEDQVLDVLLQVRWIEREDDVAGALVHGARDVLGRHRRHEGVDRDRRREPEPNGPGAADELGPLGRREARQLLGDPVRNLAGDSPDL
jgi:hypothetical protein